MKKSLKMRLRHLNRSEYEQIRSLSHIAKNLYNQSLWTILDHYKRTGEYLTYCQMDKKMKQIPNLEGNINYRLLKAKVNQQILRKLDKNWKSFFRALKDYKSNSHKYSGQPKPPRFVEDSFYHLIYDYQAFQVRQGKAVLDENLSIGIPEMLHDKRIVQIEIIPTWKTFDVVCVYEDKQTYQSVPQSERTMSIDLGLDNLATCVTNGVCKPFIIDGKQLKAINQYYNKKLAHQKSILDKRTSQKWSNQLQSLTDKRNRKVRNYLHKASRLIVNSCLEQNISQVVIGNVSYSTNKINLGKKTNQNFVNLSIGQLVSILQYKLEQHDIQVTLVDESYTSLHRLPPS